MSSCYKKTARFAGGWISKNKFTDGCDVFVICPNTTEELTNVLNCDVGNLPELLQNWERSQDHGRIVYPWSINRRNNVVVGMILFYY